EGGEDFGALFSWLRDKTSGFEEATSARHAFGEVVFGIFGEARNGADVLALHVEEQRTADRIFTRGNGFERWRNAVDGRNLEGVLVLVVERQAEDADGIGVGGQAREGLGVVTGDFDNNVLTEGGLDGFDFLVGEAFWQLGSF